jgi:hypothetical protein
VLEEAGFPHIFIEDDGDHLKRITQRLKESFVFFSENLGGSSAVQPHGKLTMGLGSLHNTVGADVTANSGCRAKGLSGCP